MAPLISGGRKKNRSRGGGGGGPGGAAAGGGDVLGAGSRQNKKLRTGILEKKKKPGHGFRMGNMENIAGRGGGPLFSLAGGKSGGDGERLVGATQIFPGGPPVLPPFFTGVGPDW